MIGVTEKLAKTNALLADSCARHQRPRASVKLLAVSKKQPASAIRAVAGEGQLDIGENYVSEALAKQAELADCTSLRWHYIGSIQANKTRAIAQNFDVVHTLDRLRIAERLSAQRPHYAAPLDIMIQVNVDTESTKSGVAPTELAALVEAVADLPRLNLVGLMCLPRPSDDQTVQRRAFRTLAELAAEVRASGELPLPELSMGMSGDLDAAIAEGATWVRIGTAIFGSRGNNTP